MKVMLGFLVRLCCVFLLIFLHASFGTAQKVNNINHGSPTVREDHGPNRGNSPSPPIGRPGSHP
ncbi:hypothetical protein I3843_15G125800 [Carya illinoinensis]|uniref:Uncharacterized protein n=1 Tax=Carya illinoinensis TaxID=32201 RepID=A0A8T1NCQ1_CARIL|nr:hypothetical protein CIPAW_15G146800 [Carya illinoinensis]KAG7944885.1 hypothetical protein I3843_15G125800 [Carya illinoinensis]